jgi:hypothetical protein
MAAALRADVPLERLDVAAYTVPTNRPESDGTLEWDSTTIVVVDAAAGTERGLGYTYSDASAAQLVERRLRRAIEGGSMVLDVLLEQGVQIAFSVTHVRPRLVSARERAGRALDVQGTTAVLELEEIMHLGSGEAVQHSSDLFAPGGIDLQVRRNLVSAAPAPLVRAVTRSGIG